MIEQIRHDEEKKSLQKIYEGWDDERAQGYEEISTYIEQEEKKDELSKVKDEIISLYRNYVFSDKLSERIVIREKITTLEVKHNLRKLECE